jgi:acetyl esterase/lipase
MFNTISVILLLLICINALYGDTNRGGFNQEKPKQIIIKEVSGELPGEKTTCFLTDTQRCVPCVILCHAFGEQYQSYQELIEHCVRMGAAVVYASARKVSFTRNKIREYDFGIKAISDVAGSIKSIDTSQVIIIGHGFGAGAVPALMKGLREKGWGKKAAVMYLMSPWYLYSISERELSAYPDSVSMVVEIFQNDNYNDPMIAADIFTKIGIPVSRKAFMIVRSDNVGKRRSVADYTLPLGNQSLSGICDYLDTIAVFNVIDSLFSYGFGTYGKSDSSFLKFSTTDSLFASARLGYDSVPPILVTDSPFVYIPNGPYLNPWKSVRNPRVEVSHFRKFRKLTMHYKVNKVNQVSRYLVRKVTSETGENVSGAVVNPIDSGFGADGSFSMKKFTCRNPDFPEQNVYVFLPESICAPVPILLFLHGYNGGDPSYFSHFIPHIVSNGIGVIFPTYSSFPTVNNPDDIMDKYRMLYSGIYETLRLYGNYFDTTNVGIFGHSFGGGAVPWIALKFFSEKGWGQKSAFLFVSAPWYVYGINDSGFLKLPSNLKASIVTYNDDAFNDHQMAVSMFLHLNVPLSEKRFFTFFSDTLDSMIQSANHFVPYGIENINGVQDNLDYFGIFKLFDALSSYSFSGNIDAKKCALGKKSELQSWTGVWPDGTPVKPIESTTSPKAKQSENKYVFAWDNPLNPWYEGKLPSRERIGK